MITYLLRLFMRPYTKWRLKWLIHKVKMEYYEGSGNWSNQKIDKYKFTLAKIVYLKRKFEPWGEYFLVKPYGFSYTDSQLKIMNAELELIGAGKLNQVLCIDLRDGRYAQPYDEEAMKGSLFMKQKPYSNDFDGPDLRSF